MTKSNKDENSIIEVNDNMAGLSADDKVNLVYDCLGGVENMVEWAKENPDLFYTKIYVKLLGKQKAKQNVITIEDTLGEIDIVTIEHSKKAGQ